MTNKEKVLPRRGALGKGMNSLLGGVDLDQEISTQSGGASRPQIMEAGRVAVLELDPNLIDPNPQQPRRFFLDKELEELASSIRTDGVIMPLVVTAGERPGRYTLIAGERRLRASKLVGLPRVPVIVKEGVADDLLRLALIENIQRADLNVIEEAQAYQSLISDYGLTQEQCAQKVGKDRSTVTNALRILSLPKEIQDDIIEQRMTMGHGRALLPLEDKKQMLRARDIIIKKGLSVRQTEKLCKTLKQGAEPDSTEKSSKNGSPDLDYIADRLRGHLRTKVKLAGSGSRGRIEISYFSATELERILAVIGNRV